MDQEQINIAFHNRANDALNDLFGRFKASTAIINRRQDENVFQQQVAKYANQLKHHLNEIALQLLNQSHTSAGDEPGRELSRFVDSYVLAFRQKAFAL